MLPKPFECLNASDISKVSFNRGEYVFHQDNICSGMYFVCDGHVELQRFSETGQRLVIHRAIAGQTFAEASLFSEKYHCDAIAQSQSSLIKFKKEGVLNLFSTNPQFAIKMVQRFAVQVQAYRRRLELLAVRSAEDRVYIALSEGLMSGTVMSFASEIGLTHEATYRALALLVKKEKIRKIDRGSYQAINYTSKLKTSLSQ